MLTLQSTVQFYIYSRAAIERLPPHDVPHVLISISTTNDDSPRLPTSNQCRGILRLTFPDSDRVIHGYTEADLFSVSHADQVWDFVLAHRSDIERIVLHCDAGVSRSPAVAAALAKVLNGDDAEFFKRYRPNVRVYRTLLHRYFDRGGREG